MSMAHNIGPIMADHDRGPQYALVQCIGDDFTCTAESRVEQSALLSDADIVAILAERGWSVSPTLCPAHSSEGRDS